MTFDAADIRHLSNPLEVGVSVKMLEERSAETELQQVGWKEVVTGCLNASATDPPDVNTNSSYITLMLYREYKVIY